MGKNRLVIFDCDGVLVDSEPISIAVLLEIIGAAGVEISEAQAYQRFLGRSMASIAGVLDKEFGLSITATHLDAIRTRLYEKFRNELKAVPGVADAIDRLVLPFCVASSSQPERIRLSLEITGLLDRFEPRIYSSTMVDQGKPAPDLFLHAAREMGARPSDCIVIEDSSAGIEAARRAGMGVFAFTGGLHGAPGNLERKAAALGPDVIFNDMRALPDLVSRACEREARR